MSTSRFFYKAIQTAAMVASVQASKYVQKKVETKIKEIITEKNKNVEPEVTQHARKTLV